MRTLWCFSSEPTMPRSYIYATRITPADVAGARLIRDAIDALLGISLD